MNQVELQEIFVNGSVENTSLSANNDSKSKSVFKGSNSTLILPHSENLGHRVRPFDADSSKTTANRRNQNGSSYYLGEKNNKKRPEFDDESEYSATIESHDSENELIVIEGYRYSVYKMIFVTLAGIISCGTVFLLLYWLPKIRMKFIAVPSPLKNCSLVLIRNKAEHKSFKVEPVKEANTRTSPKSAQNTCSFVEFESCGIRRCFFYHQTLYLWNWNQNRFCSTSEIMKNEFRKLVCKINSSKNELFDGLSSWEAEERMEIFGPNFIRVDIQGIFSLLFRECLSPFYVFQIFSFTIWVIEDYIPFATILFLMSASSIALEVYQTRKQQQKIREMIEQTSPVSVLRDGGKFRSIQSDKLVPGDIVAVEKSPVMNDGRLFTLQFDGLLINGSAVVSEALLTGESVPTTKTPLTTNFCDRNLFEGKLLENSSAALDRSTLFEGSQVLQTYLGADKQTPKALVIRTGFSTVKGQLLKSILHSSPVDISFSRDLFKCIGILAIVGAATFIYSISLRLIRGGQSIWFILLRGADLITVVVPPGLPVVLTIGVVTAQWRLKQKNVFCTAPSTINTAGLVDTVCFDKTGTLTEDGLTLECVHEVGDDQQTLADKEYSPNNEEKAQRPYKKQDFGSDVQKTDDLFLHESDQLSETSHVVKACACCHSLAIIDGKVMGDPIDMTLFKWTGSSLAFSQPTNKNGCIKKPFNSDTNSNPQLPGEIISQEENENSDSFEVRLDRFVAKIIQTYPFSPNLQRMSVLVQEQQQRECRNSVRPKSQQLGQYTLYTKGSPESILSCCKIESVPENFGSIIENYARMGRRLLALAMKPIRDLESGYINYGLNRTMIERNLTLIGIVVLENRPRQSSRQVIDKLKRANLRVLMITGDSHLTALNVAQTLKMVSTTTPFSNFPSMLSEGSSLVAEQLLVVFDLVKEDSSNNLTRQFSLTISCRNVDTVEAIKYSLERVDFRMKANFMDRNCIEIRFQTSDFSFSRVVFDTINCSFENGEEFQQITPEIVITGAALNEIVENNNENLLKIVIKYGVVFARMPPNSKKLIINALQTIEGRIVAMCGDGSNDCSALKRAHIGISLSEAEASVAAPFTAKPSEESPSMADTETKFEDVESVGKPESSNQTVNLNCIPTLISEGRASLVTSFSLFKFMCTYAQTELITTLFLYWYDIGFANFQFLYIDLCLVTLVAIFFAQNGASETLAPHPPPARLLSLHTFASIFCQLMVAVLFQSLALVYTLKQPWYVRFTGPDSNHFSMEGSAIFFVSVFQYIAFAVVYSKGRPHRRPLWTNRPICLVLAAFTVLSLMIVLIPPAPIASLLEVIPPKNFNDRIIYLALGLGGFCFSLFIENAIVEKIWPHSK